MSGGIQRSAIYTALGITTLFALSVGAVLVSPQLTENSWVEPVCSYQKQMHELADPNVYLSRPSSDSGQVHTLYHLHRDSLPLVFAESETEAIFSDDSLQGYVTPYQQPLRLTHRLLLLKDIDSEAEDIWGEKARTWIQEQERSWKANNASGLMPRFKAYLLYDPLIDETFTIANSDGITENWIDKGTFTYIDADGQSQELLDEGDDGTIYARNPKQYSLSPYSLPGGDTGWKFDPHGQGIYSKQDFKDRELGAMARAELISLGETIVANEGCNTCHTFQTRTLIQDVVLNGLDHPAPPSAPGEYIYERVSFMGTKRNGPDLSRVGVKRMSRDWHMSHFWSPRTASPGSIMPSYRHFFDFATSGTDPNLTGIPSYRFEAVYQYLMTKGTRLTSPNKAWWRGGDMRTRQVLERKKK